MDAIATTAPPEQPSWFRRFFCFCIQPVDEYAENFEQEMRKSIVYGHPDLVNKVPLMSET